jgi:hypothetical protein
MSVGTFPVSKNNYVPATNSKLAVKPAVGTKNAQLSNDVQVGANIASALAPALAPFIQLGVQIFNAILSISK